MELTDGALNIAFTPPPGCGAVPEKRLAEAFAGRPVKYGCVTPGEGTSVFVTVSQGDDSESALARFERGFKAGVKRAEPSATFKRRVVKLNGSRWVNLRYTQNAGGGPVTNDVYMIDWAGHIVLFEFLAPASKYEASRAALEASAKSVGLSITVNAPVETPGASGVVKPN